MDEHTAENDAPEPDWIDGPRDEVLARFYALNPEPTRGRPTAENDALPRDCQGYALGASCGCVTADDCPLTRVIPPGEGQADA